MARRQAKNEASVLYTLGDAEALTCEIGIEGADGEPVPGHDPILICGHSPGDLLDGIDSVIESLRKTRFDLVLAFGQAADGEKVASKVGTTSAAPDGGET